MIYGLAALANEKSTYKVEVDYSLSVAKVYTDFARLEIFTSNRLDILTRVCTSLDSDRLPSWVPNWASKPNSRHHFLRTSTEPQPNFSASAKVGAIINFDTREDVLTFEGLSIGCLDLIGPSTSMESADDIDSLPPAFLRWWSVVNQMEGDQESNHEAFVRTLLCEEDFDLLHGSSTRIRWILGAFGDLFVEKRPDVPPDAILMGYWNSYLATQRLEGPQEDLNVQQHRHIQRTWTDPRRYWDRRFFTSGNKLMGLAPIEAREGDIICVPLGCWHPLILRKVEEHYINLGEAYVDGYMYGKAIDMWKVGELELQKFEIH